MADFKTPSFEPSKSKEEVLNLSTTFAQLPQYELVEKLGEGGMGTVFCVRDVEQKQLHAIKILKPGIIEDKPALKRFEKEAAASAELTHYNIAQVFGHALAEDGSPYLLMEYIDGTPLSRMLELDHFLPWERAVNIFIQIGEALTHAHSKGVIHRDLKPSNILIIEGKDHDTVKLVDFGIAKLLPRGNDLTDLTQTGEILGSPKYMSPEQASGNLIDERSDIYSMGCVLYEALAGEPLFVGENPIQTIMHHMNSPVDVRLKKLATRGVPAALVEVLRKMLKKNAKDRYQYVKEIVSELNQIKQKKIPKVLWRKRAKLIVACSLPVLAASGLLLFSVGNKIRNENAPLEIGRTPRVDPYRPTLTTSGKNPVVINEAPKILKPTVSKPLLKKLAPIDYGSPLSKDEKSAVDKNIVLIVANERGGKYQEQVAEIVKVGKRAIPLLLEYFGGKDPQLSRASALVLIKLSSVATPGVVKMLRENPQIDHEGVLYFDYAGAEGMSGLATLLLDDDPLIRSRAARIMSRSAAYGNFSSDARGQLQVTLPKSVSATLTWILVNDENAATRSDAAQALCWAAITSSMVEALEYASLNDDSDKVQASAAASLVKIIPRQSAGYNDTALKVVGYILQQSESERVRQAIFEMFSRPGSSSSNSYGELVPYIRPLLNDRSASIKLAAVDALGNMGTSSFDALPDLVSALDDPACRERAAYAIAHFGPSAASLAAPKLQALQANPSTKGGGVGYALDCLVGKYVH